ncbi:hypothetical protein LTR86_005865 [Recurvomyces mirabilis]|nr:hypothetical protein LTR86_005865 [Recurvomyces mirabilis]
MAPPNPNLSMAARTATNQPLPFQRILTRITVIEGLQHQLAEQVASLRPLLQILDPATIADPASSPEHHGSERGSAGAGEARTGQRENEDRISRRPLPAPTRTASAGVATAVASGGAPVPQQHFRPASGVRCRPPPSPTGARYTTLASVDDYAIRKKIEELSCLLPDLRDISIQQYHDALVRHRGSVEDAAEWLREMEHDDPPVPVHAVVSARRKQRGVKRKSGVTFEREGEDEIVVGGGRRKCVVRFCLTRQRLGEVLSGGLGR